MSSFRSLARCQRVSVRHFSACTEHLHLHKSQEYCIRGLASFIQPRLKIAPRHKPRRFVNMEDLETNGWIETKHLNIFPWSVSGLESCIVAKNSQVSVAFDMGYAFPEAVRCNHVLISHGHVDHISGLPQHAAKRSLYSLDAATYYTPPHLTEPLKKMAALMREIHDPEQGIAPMKWVEATTGTTVNLEGGWFVRPFPTFHRVKSQGYILYRRWKALKPEYRGFPSKEIGILLRSGVQVHDTGEEPVLAYTGDTTFEVFVNSPPEDLLRVDTLITETTYIDDVIRQGVSSVTKAQQRGHSHLQEFIDNQHLFEHINNIIFIHFSDKYSSRYIKERCEDIIPEPLKSKVHLALQLKTITESIKG